MNMVTQLVNVEQDNILKPNRPLIGISVRSSTILTSHNFKILHNKYNPIKISNGQTQNRPFEQQFISKLKNLYYINYPTNTIRLMIDKSAGLHIQNTYLKN